jgi:hypothetical protein
VVGDTGDGCGAVGGAIAINSAGAWRIDDPQVFGPRSYLCKKRQLRCGFVLPLATDVMLDHTVLFEMLAPSQQGPVYVRLVPDAKFVRIGGEFDLNVAQVEAWVAILKAMKGHMRRSG